MWPSSASSSCRCCWRPWSPSRGWMTTGTTGRMCLPVEYWVGSSIRLAHLQNCINNYRFWTEITGSRCRWCVTRRFGGCVLLLPAVFSSTVWWTRYDRTMRHLQFRIQKQSIIFSLKKKNEESISKRHFISSLIYRNRDFDEKLASNRLFKWISKNRYPLF